MAVNEEHPVSVSEYLEQLNAAVEADRKKHEKKPLPAVKKTAENATAVKNTKVSTTDPESGFMHRDNKPKGFFYLDHRTVDGKYGIIMDTHVTPGNVHDSQPFIGRLARQVARFNLDTVAVGVDAGYFTPAVCHLTQERGIALVPGYRRPHKGQNDFQKKHFRYDEGRDVYVCPAEELLIYGTTDRNGYRHYRSDPGVCQRCEQRGQCTQNPQGAENNHAARMGSVERRSQQVAADEMGQEGLCAAQGNGGKKLRGCETAPWSQVCPVPRVDESADAMPVGGSGAKHQEDSAAGASLSCLGV